MPKLVEVKDISEWGDMIRLPSGRIYSLDSCGLFQQVYGPPAAPLPEVGVPYSGNEDNGENSCAQIALTHLGVEHEAVKEYRSLHPTDGVPYAIIESCLAEFERVEFEGTVGEFVTTHPTGSFYVSAEYADGLSHGFALIDGSAHNLSFRTLKFRIRKVYRREK